MTPAEELLDAMKEHATAEVSFEFIGGGYPTLFMDNVSVGWHVRNKNWYEQVGDDDYTHDSASSAVYSAFLRARK